MFRFTIRELVLLTLVVGLGVAWLVDRSRLTAEIDQMRSRLIEGDSFNRKFRRNARATITELENAMKAAGVPIPNESRGATIGDVLDKMEVGTRQPPSPDEN